jgi:hypothetical protein
MTFDEYIKNPAGKGASVITNRQMYQNMYQKQFDELLVRENGLIMYHLYIGSDDYYIHFKIPSEISPNFYYDTIIRFYTTKSSIKMERTLRNYDIQVYSNDANFVFTYCYAFNSRRMFIKDLSGKMSELALKQKAKIKNPRNELGYVKSIYFAYIEMKRGDLFTKSRWETVSTKYNKNVWNQSVDHADDKIKKANELINADRKTRKRLDNKEKNKNKEFEKASPPITSKFKSPNQKNFGHFRKEAPNKFNKFVEKTKKGFGHFKIT